MWQDEADEWWGGRGWRIVGPHPPSYEGIRGESEPVAHTLHLPFSCGTYNRAVIADSHPDSNEVTAVGSGYPLGDGNFWNTRQIKEKWGD